MKYIKYHMDRVQPIQAWKAYLWSTRTSLRRQCTARYLVMLCECKNASASAVIEEWKTHALLMALMVVAMLGVL